MHPELIKAEMRMRGVTPAALADQLGLTRPSVTSVINGKQTSRPVMDAVAKVLDRKVSDLWPQVKPATGLRRSKKAVAA
jgi:lambda repressor-like predicted transcriptional regulator